MKLIEDVLKTSRPGKLQATLKVTSGEAEELNIPVLVIEGSKPGPTTLIQGGSHGDEFDGPEAARRYWRVTDPATIAGRVLLIPALNLPAYLAASRMNPADPVDMSSVWPGDSAGSITAQIAWNLTTKVLPHIDQLLDLHGGGDIFDIYRLVMFHEPEDRSVRERIMRLAQGTGISHMWRFPGSSGLSGYMASQGKAAIGVEIGGEARLCETAVRDNLQAIHNFLATAGNECGNPVLPRQWTVIEGRPDHSRHAGFLQSFVRLGDWVAEGDRIGVIADVAGNELEQVYAVQTGIVTTIRTKPILPAGGATFQVSSVAATFNNPAYEEKNHAIQQS